MAQTLGWLTALKVARLSEPGTYRDGGGLYLQITNAAAKSWVYRYKLAGKTRMMGLGSLNTVGLSEARRGAAQCRLQRQAGLDPIEARKAQRAASHWPQQAP